MENPEIVYVDRPICVVTKMKLDRGVNLFKINLHGNNKMDSFTFL